MPRTIQSVSTAASIIDILRVRDGSTLTEIARETDLTPGTVHTHLATLKECNYVIQDGDEYRLGYHLLSLGEAVRNHHDLYRAAKAQIDKLAEETDESVHLIVEQRGQIYTLCERFGREAVGIEAHEKKREQPLTHLHCTAAGKAILSQLPRGCVKEITERNGLPPVTENTITELDVLLEELETVRERGYGFSDEEQMIGIRAVGAPITYNDEIAGAIAVSGPTARLKEGEFRETLPEQIIQAKNICEVNLQTVSNDALSFERD